MTDQARDLASAAAYLDSMTQGANTLAHLLDARVPEATVALAVTSAARALGWSPAPPVTPVALPVIQTCGDCGHFERDVQRDAAPGRGWCTKHGHCCVGEYEAPEDWCPLRTAIPLAKVWTREEVNALVRTAASWRDLQAGAGAAWPGLDVFLTRLLDGEKR